jgi:hypothetical protein
MSRSSLVSVVTMATLALAGCGAMKSLQASTRAAVAKIPKFPKLPVPADSPDAIKIAKVRPQDLKDLPLGRERAQAYERDRMAGAWLPGWDVKFDESEPPIQEGEMDGSLLPPNTP